MRYIKLGEVIESAKCRRCGEDDYPVLSITKSDGIILQSEKFKKRIASQDTAQYKVVCRGQLVQGIHIDEANFGIQDIVEEGIVSPAYKIWNVHTDKISGQYLAEVLRSPRSIRYYSSNFNGSVKRRERLTDKDFLAMDIPCPSLEEQANVLEIIGKARNVIANRELELERLDDLIKARFVELFGNKGENPNGYDEDTLGNLYKFQYGKGNNIPEDKGEYPCYGSNGQVGHHTEYNSEDAPIIGHIGAYAGIVNWGEGKHYVTYNGVICNLKSDRINPVYGFYLLQQQDFNRVATKGGGQPFVSYGDLESPVVVVPPIEVQEAYAMFAKQVDKSKFAVQKALEDAQLLFNSLMQKYFG